MEAWEPSYQDLENYYREYYSLGNLNCDIGSKFALISLICFLTNQASIILREASSELSVNNSREGYDSQHDLKFIRGLSVVCTDMMKHCNEFLTFDMKSSKEMVKKIKEILHTYLPF